jgi:hypothetical protein
VAPSFKVLAYARVNAPAYAGETLTLSWLFWYESSVYLPLEPDPLEPEPLREPDELPDDPLLEPELDDPLRGPFDCASGLELREPELPDCAPLLDEPLEPPLREPWELSAPLEDPEEPLRELDEPLFELGPPGVEVAMATWNSCRLSERSLFVSALEKSKPWIWLPSSRLIVPSLFLSAWSNVICCVRSPPRGCALDCWLD